MSADEVTPDVEVAEAERPDVEGLAAFFDDPTADGTVEVAEAPAAHPALMVTASGLDLIRQTIAPDLTDAELRLFGNVANRVGLDPFARQIYATKRGGKMVIQTGIDGYRLIARRTGDMRGRLGPYFAANDGKGWRVGPDGKPLPWLDSNPPAAAMVGVLRAGDDEPTWGVATWAEYAIQGTGDAMWRKMPSTMLAKCAEAQAIRATFPAETAGIYTEEEMAQAGAPDAPRSSTSASSGRSGPPVAGAIIDPWHAKPRELADALRARNLAPGGTVPEMRKRLADALDAERGSAIEVEAEEDDDEAGDAGDADDPAPASEGQETAAAAAAGPVELCAAEGCGVDLDGTGGVFTPDGVGYCPDHAPFD